MENSGKSENIAPNQVLLIDLENCPNQIQKLQKNLENFSQVIICYARSDAKIPLDWLTSLNGTINENKLKIFKMPNGGKNAADFGICFFAGMLMVQLPEDTHFVIVSNDADLDHVVNLLKSQCRSAERVGAAKKDENKVQNQSKTIELMPEIQQFCSHLIIHTKNRPAKKETLINTIKSLVKKDEKFIQDIINFLVSYGAINISGSKLIYDNTKIKELAKT
jgi:hypothetical protein